MGGFLDSFGAAVLSITVASAADGCESLPSGHRRLRAAPLVVALSLRALAPHALAVDAAAATLQALDDASSGAAPALLRFLRAAGLTLCTGVWLRPVAGASTSVLAVVIPDPAVVAATAEPPPPSPPQAPPFPRPWKAPPAARGGVGGAKNRHRPPAADSEEAAVGYTIAALLVLWLPVHMCFHAATAAHVRRTTVTLAVALQCDAALARGSSDVRLSFTERVTRRLTGPLGGGEHETEVAGAEAYVLKGRRFAAPGLADAAASFFSAESRGVAVVRPLLRSPLLAALGSSAKGQESAMLAAQKAPVGVWSRLRRALHSELAWHKRAFQHAVRGIKRCMTPRMGAAAHGAATGAAGHAFRLVRAEEWLAPSTLSTPFTPVSTPMSVRSINDTRITAAIFEVTISFGFIGGRAAAASFRASMRDGERLQQLEAAFAERLAAMSDHGSPTLTPKAAPLGVCRVGTAMVALLDDEPYACLDAGLSRKLDAASGSPRPEGLLQSGLSADVAERLGVLLVLCLHDKDAAQRRANIASGRIPATSFSFSYVGTPRARDYGSEPPTPAAPR